MTDPIEVFPTRVGVYQELEAGNTAVMCFPHACGGVPLRRRPALITQ